eukprot:TRINITY_DN61589_c0_g1_i3.p2 TRINITY_DN61589_c0_g1~~TRINITY_DN61589_c0_g1_i3.p2  ORF type:complete len:112 (+),score=9.81 TRINITY_DN61589_c0_g1_i3:477-812(+)
MCDQILTPAHQTSSTQCTYHVCLAMENREVWRWCSITFAMQVCEFVQWQCHLAAGLPRGGLLFMERITPKFENHHHGNLGTKVPPSLSLLQQPVTVEVKNSLVEALVCPLH